MSYATYYFTANGEADCIDGGYENIGAAIFDLLELWNEDEGDDPADQYFEVRDNHGLTLATLWRPQPESDPELALVVYHGIESQPARAFRCTYVLDADGRYMRTDISEVDAQIPAAA